MGSDELIEQAERLLIKGCSTAYGDRRFTSSRPHKTVHRFKVWRALVLALILANVLAQDLSTNISVSRKTSKVVDCSLYSEKECINVVYSIDWGRLRPGVPRYAAICVKNTGTEALSLHLSEENWNPESAADCISLQWNYSGDMVEAGDVV